jgi:hypothetical protein
MSIANTPDSNLPLLIIACLAAELQRLRPGESIILLLVDITGRCKRAAEGEADEQRGTLQ